MKRKFTVLIDGQETAFELEKTGEGSARLLLDDKSFDIDIASLGDGDYSLLHDGRSYAVGLVRKDETVQASWRGETMLLKLIDERAKRRKGAGSGVTAGAGSDVVSPMPGRVVKVHVSAGQKVAAGDGVVVVEAMKMENEFKAPRDGVVKEVRVKVGDSVDGGAILVVME